MANSERKYLRWTWAEKTNLYVFFLYVKRKKREIAKWQNCFVTSDSVVLLECDRVKL